MRDRWVVVLALIGLLLMTYDDRPGLAIQRPEGGSGDDGGEDDGGEDDRGGDDGGDGSPLRTPAAPTTP